MELIILFLAVNYTFTFNPFILKIFKCSFKPYVKGVTHPKISWVDISQVGCVTTAAKKTLYNIWIFVRVHLPCYVQCCNISIHLLWSLGKFDALKLLEIFRIRGLFRVVFNDLNYNIIMGTTFNAKHESILASYILTFWYSMCTVLSDFQQKEETNTARLGKSAWF